MNLILKPEYVGTTITKRNIKFNTEDVDDYEYYFNNGFSDCFEVYKEVDVTQIVETYLDSKDNPKLKEDIAFKLNLDSDLDLSKNFKIENGPTRSSKKYKKKDSQK